MPCASCLRARELSTARSAMHRPLPQQPQRTCVETTYALGEGPRDKGGGEHSLACRGAARTIDAGAVKNYFDVKSRFVSPDELLRLTGLVPGSIPPFGKPLLPFEVFVDPSILDNERIAFNAGSLTDSIIMSVDDYLRIARPEVFVFSSCSSPEG